MASVLVHVPLRNLFGVLVALAALAGFGVQAWLAASSARERALLLAPGIVVWGALPLLAGVDRSHLVLPLVAGGVGLLLLIMAARRPAWAVLLPVLVAAELCVNAAAGQTRRSTPTRNPLPGCIGAPRRAERRCRGVPSPGSYRNGAPSPRRRPLPRVRPPRRDSPWLPDVPRPGSRHVGPPRESAGHPFRTRGCAGLQLGSASPVLVVRPRRYTTADRTTTPVCSSTFLRWSLTCFR